MLGIAIIAGFLVYLAVSWGVVFAAAVWAKKRGRRPLLWGGLAFLIMYNLVFWDLIPTYLVFKYKSATESGFWVYKTPEQWKEENPGVAETLTWRRLSENYSAPDITDGYRLNERMVWIINVSKTPILPVKTREERIVDIKENRTLVKRVKIYSGYRGGSGFIRFWARHSQPWLKAKEFNIFFKAYKTMGDEIK
jgi:hypothetical protein